MLTLEMIKDERLPLTQCCPHAKEVKKHGKPCIDNTMTVDSKGLVSMKVALRLALLCSGQRCTNEII